MSKLAAYIRHYSLRPELLPGQWVRQEERQTESYGRKLVAIEHSSAANTHPKRSLAASPSRSLLRMRPERTKHGGLPYLE